MRSVGLFAVALLALIASALPIQSAFAATLSLNIAPTVVVLGGSVTFSGTEDPVSVGSLISLLIYPGSNPTCEGPAMLYTGAGVEDNSGNYHNTYTTTTLGLDVGQYYAYTLAAVSDAASPCVGFRVDITYPTDYWDRFWFEGGWDYDEGFWERGEYLGQTQETTLMFDNNWGYNIVAFGEKEYLGFMSGRTITLPCSGVYTFYLGSDDGSRLYIDDTKVIDMWQPQGYTVQSAGRSLTAGPHTFRIDWFEETGLAHVSFRYVAPPCLVLTPAEGCPGTVVGLVFTFEGTLNSQVISSSPPGLFDTEGFSVCGVSGEDDYWTITCDARVLESACPGRYTVTFTAGGQSASAVFTVPSTCPSCAAVGGCVQPVNTFALLSPWLAVIGLVGCISTGAVIVKKRRS